ncbi:type I-F CRISPR-associated endoribonuclease Cas6/Csy4 [Psychrobacter fozii]|uniref:type I-F CRISPR-associated endoribonuclease Cas6/Csy4 n=1 Tax=Psychrobacter fozii TaxID=198480 RepID=UPI00191AC81B|nr:type I-F CRISPR-associated endoribonuclease Cas6/Csy4 [Psychrobacter fozii]
MTESTSLIHYCEITIIPDPEIAPYFIWSKLFAQFHIALAEMKNKHGIESIGVSFPDYHYDEKGKSSKLGLKLRVFAPSQRELDTLNLDKWLERLTDYVHIKGIKQVPTDRAISYVSVHRYRFKPIDVQAQTLAKKLSISYDEAMVIVAKRKPEMALPFIRMRSETNKSYYPLKVLQQPRSEAKAGRFTVYGMNGMTNSITVPHW